MARFSDNAASVPVPPRPKSYYDLIVEDVKRCEPETRDKIMEAIEDLDDDINNSAYTMIFDSIDEYEIEAKTHDDQRCVVDEIKEIVESNGSQRTLSLIYYRGKRIKYTIVLIH